MAPPRMADDLIRRLSEAQNAVQVSLMQTRQDLEGRLFRNHTIEGNGLPREQNRLCSPQAWTGVGTRPHLPTQPGAPQL